MMGKGSEETDNKKGGGKEDIISSILIALAIFVWSIGIAAVYIDLRNHSCCLQQFDEDPMRTVLGILGLGLVIINMIFIIIRIRESQKTNKLADKNLQESKQTTYLNDLHQGINMLYSDSFTKQRGGVEYLHNIAETYKEDSERVEQIFELFRLFVKEISLEERKEVVIGGIGADPTVVIKEEILYKITPKEPNKSIYKNVNSDIDLKYAELGSANLHGNNVCLKGAILWGAKLQGANLQGANLQEADLRGAHLLGAYLQRANLQDAILQGAYSGDGMLHLANLSYALVDKEHQGKLGKALTKHTIWLGDMNLKGEKFYYKDEEFPYTEKGRKDLIIQLEKEKEEKEAEKADEDRKKILKEDIKAIQDAINYMKRVFFFH